MGTSGPKAAAEWIARGCRFFEVVDKMTLLRRGAEDTVDTYRTVAGGPQSRRGRENPWGTRLSEDKALTIVIIDGQTPNPGDLSWDRLNRFGLERIQVLDGRSVDNGHR